MATAQHASTCLDLRAFDAPQRSEIWRVAATRLFPGLEVREQLSIPAAGRLSGVSLDAGQLWTVLSPPLRIRYAPQPAVASTGAFVSVMMQRTGTTQVRQRERECTLHARDLTLIDDGAAFELDITEGLSELVFLRIPRDRALTRIPAERLQTAARLDPECPMVMLLEALLQKLPGMVERMTPEQQCQTLDAIVQLLPAPGEGRQMPGDVQHPGWRAQAAIAFIDAELPDRQLNAGRVAAAQGVSRRRLDEILIRETGSSLTAQIWQRRLLRAADDLRNPRLRDCSVTRIALQCGFEHAAHFARAFRRQFRCTPSQWRTQTAGD